MKQKLLNALKQGYPQLGLSDAVFERAATFGATFITSDEQIESFVKASEAMLKAEQSAADKVRTELNAKIKGLEGEKADLEAKLNGNQPEDKPEPTKPETPDWAALIEAALDKKLNPITEKIAAFEAENAKKSAVATLDKFVSEWDYAKGFPKESETSKRIALKVYKAGGEKMTGEELIAAFREEFDPAVQSKGTVDFSKPFESNGGAGGDDEDFSSFDRAAQKLGWVEPKK